MLEKLTWNIAPPEFDNQGNRAMAELLNIVLLVFIAAVGLVAAGVTFIEGNTYALIFIFGIAFLFLGVFFIFTINAKVQLAYNLIIPMFWLFPTLNAIYVGGIFPAVYVTYITVVIIAGIVLGVRASVVYALLSSLVVALFPTAQIQAIFPGEMLDNSQAITWLGLSINMLVVIAVIHVARSNIHITLTRSNQDGEFFTATNQEMKANRLQLIEQAIELTKANKELKREITIRRKVEQEKNKSLAEKEVLLKEIHHRVKNNLQIVSSLLYLQSKKVKNRESQNVFLESQNRIRAMSLVHEKLYQSDNLAAINLDEHLHSLVKSLFTAYGITNNQVTYIIDAENILLDVELAIPCSVIISELVSNALKHAFPNGAQGEISIEVCNIRPSGWKILVKDNGIGIAKKSEAESETTLGLQLVHNLAAQLNGEVTINSADTTEIEILFSGVIPHSEEE